jgi:hypothetical protein
MGFELFGLSQTFSIVVLIALFVVAVVAFALGLWAVLSMIDRARHRRRPDAAEATEVLDDLIPPIYYTDHMKDPLRQEDLCERVRVPK